MFALSSQSDFVCRVPLYMKCGMMRVRLRKTGIVTLTEEQLEVVHQTHRILSRLSFDINKPINFDLNFDDDLLTFYSSGSSTTLIDSGLGEKGLSYIATDPYSELEMDPLKAPVCGMLLIVRLSGKAFLARRVV